MKKYVYLGVNGENCCLLYTLANWDLICSGDEIVQSDFVHASSGWCGYDTIKKTLSLNGLKMTGEKFTLIEPLKIDGVDRELGKRYPWTFIVSEIYRLEDD